uniref:DNA topoisomerase (ATP-hydrolyzing) n=1 Tax=Percolomonas cosmopolitus TaxID=63605 RepID=A0A7S1KQM8_9EUKA|mmetsp:Transcript_4669/g.17553  ORF Transcript_4669/g.17553 Transcript_4669/m.17553 type:complete len:307 (+) Transcript_4669:347-1267(+)
MPLPLHPHPITARSVFLMDCILKLHHAQATESKRDLYYQNTKLFGSQKSVDKIVDDIACSIGVSRRHLRIVAKCKGLIHGHIQVRLQNGLIVRVSDDHKTILPINPNIDTYAHIDVTCIQFVLVVEKDAVFSRLVQLGYAQKAKCLLVTGKGYPDVATRLFLSRIARENPHLPVLCLVDGDPHGIDIFLIYKYGSAAMRHQCDELAVPTMEWIGLDVSHDYKQFGIPMCTLLEMGVRETKKAQKICDQMIPSDEACVQCLETMLKMLKKAEIEALSSMGFSFLSDVYLPQKVGNILVNRMLQDEDE